MIYISGDHTAVSMMTAIKTAVTAAGYEIQDIGMLDPYPNAAAALCEKVTADPAHKGILVCGTGIGISIAANKHAGIRAAVVENGYTAEFCRRHNDANVICLGARVTAELYATELVKIFLAAPYEGGRYAECVNMLTALDNS